MNNSKQVYYWSPFIDRVATIKAVYNSFQSLKKYSKGYLDPKIIDAFGEWKNETNYNLKKDDCYGLCDLKFINKISSYGFFKSRFKYILIFIACFFPLKNLLKLKKPDYLIIHLITSLPLILNLLFTFDTKIILRISGKPQLNFIRKFFWKITLKKIFKVTFPTIETMDYFKQLNLVEQEKLTLLYDPVLSIKEIKENFEEDEIEEPYLVNKKFFLAIGRLTKQKNFNFLIDCFDKLLAKDNSINLVIIGKGENYQYLKNKIYKNRLNKNIFLVGYKKNVFKYLKKSEAFILSSLWEDPGFVIIEAMYSNTFVISSDCKSGPKEMLENKRGVLFKNNSKSDFIEKFNYYSKLDKKHKFKVKVDAKKFTKEFTLYKHYIKIKNIL